MINPVGSPRVGPVVPAAAPRPDCAAAPAEGEGFASQLRRQLEEVSRVQADAERSVQDLVTGRTDNLTDVRRRNSCATCPKTRRSNMTRAHKNPFHRADSQQRIKGIFMMVCKQRDDARTSHVATSLATPLLLSTSTCGS